MNTYEVRLEWSGYSRGTQTQIVEAETAEQAHDEWYTGQTIEHNVIRDNFNYEVKSVELVSEE